MEPEMEPGGTPELETLIQKKLPQCCMCSNQSIMYCGRCRLSNYCSYGCQGADWPNHMVICTQWLSFIATPPNPSTRCGIFFPSWAPHPEFVWMKTEWTPIDPAKDEDSPGFEKINLKPFLGTGVIESIRISANAFRSRRREHDHIQLFYRPDAVVDGSARNMCTATLTYGTDEFYPWSGSLLAMKSPNPSIFDPVSRVYSHMDAGDFRDLVDLFISYNSEYDMNDMKFCMNHKGHESPLAKALQARAALYDEDPADLLHSKLNSGKRNFQWVPGVRINCWSDMCGRGKDMYEDVMVPIDDPIWGKIAQPTIISDLVGFPIRTRRVRPTSDNDEANLEATLLHVDAYHQSEHWGQPYPRDWKMCTGSVLVVHDERIPIRSEEIQLLCSFCMDFLQPCIEESLEDPANSQMREAIFRTLVTPRSFHQFRSDFYLVGRGAEDIATRWEADSTAGTATAMNLMIRVRLDLQHWKSEE